MSNLQGIESGIRDNHGRGTVGSFLREKIAPGSQLSVVSAYFTIYAYQRLKHELDRLSSVRFLFGEPRFLASVDPEKGESKQFIIDPDGLELANALQQRRAARECAEWISNRVEVKSIKRSNLLHGKLFHIGNDGRDHAILGSSNFTVRGLGLAHETSNLELNLVVDSDRDRADLKQWFDELWDDEELVRDVKDDVLAYLHQLYLDRSPQFIYYKTLFHLFEDSVLGDDRGRTLDEEVRLFDTKIWKMLFEFQKDGAKASINKVLTHNGAVLADSVGLGKTFEALAVIKYFELRNERALVLCPKRLEENWLRYRNNDKLNPIAEDRFRYDVLAHTDLSRQEGRSSSGIDLRTIRWENYDLVVIDESHNFRNNSRGRRDEDGNVIRKSRYERLMEDIVSAGIRTKVLLLSATPVNTTLKDLRNQLYFVTAGKDAGLYDSAGIESIGQTLKRAQQTFSVWSQLAAESRSTTHLLQELDADFFTLLDELTIARSRKHVERYYEDAVRQLGGFPRREKPSSIFAEIDSRKRFLSYDKLNDEISEYKLSVFNPSKYVLPDRQEKYSSQLRFPFTQEEREFYLIGMMKVNFLKRLESSIAAFRITMEHTLDKIESLLGKIEDYRDGRSSSAEVATDSMADEEDEELQEAFLVGKALQFHLDDMDIERWLQDLDQDRQQINLLLVNAQQVTADRDAKLHTLKERINEKFANPTVDNEEKENRKVLVFTAFSDTASYLYENLKPWVSDHLGGNIALVTGGAGNKSTVGTARFEEILTNFAPRAKDRSQLDGFPEEEIDVLVATDCISEGQNLQDCDLLINYDIHWNPVRIIQRFGRIDRIGSINKTVKMVNFWPTEHLEKYITLKNRVEARMALVDIAATLEDDVLNTGDTGDLIQADLRYRDQQLLRMRDEILDLEDFSDTVNLSDFSLDDFRMDLARFIEQNRELLENAPLGLYSLVASQNSPRKVVPGVIFCLRRSASKAKREGVNPLHPYFLVYIQSDGEIRFNFVHPKQILETFRSVAADKGDADSSLVELFNQETRNGGDMSGYSELLTKSMKAIKSAFDRRAKQGIQNNRSFVIPRDADSMDAANEYELVTWLVVKERT